MSALLCLRSYVGALMSALYCRALFWHVTGLYRPNINKYCKIFSSGLQNHNFYWNQNFYNRLQFLLLYYRGAQDLGAIGPHTVMLHRAPKILSPALETVSLGEEAESSRWRDWQHSTILQLSWCLSELICFPVYFKDSSSPDREQRHQRPGSDDCSVYCPEGTRARLSTGRDLSPDM